MKIAFINAVPYGSTGRIVKQINNYCKNKGDDTLVFFSWSKKKHRVLQSEEIHTSSFLGKVYHIMMAKITGKIGCFSIIDTYKVIHMLKNFNPDVLHIHLLHAWSFNLHILFSYIKKNNIPVVWTMHDCWAMTGHCAHFTIARCEKWKTGCFNCPSYKDYPSSYVDSSKKMWKKKKELFTGIPNITIVSPSRWLSNIVKESYLGNYRVKVINNGIDLSVFKPTKSRFRDDYKIGKEKKIILGVSFDWGYKKGLDVFCELSKRLESCYQIVLVGIDEDKASVIPDNIITIKRTQSQQELAEIYSSADVFFNPTREEVLGLVNIEALACGTPVITFDSGGSPECIDDNCGIVINNQSIEEVLAAIDMICINGMIKNSECIKRAQQFNGEIINQKYYELLHEVVKK